MSGRPGEATELNTRLLRCTLEVEDSRAYWARADGRPVTAHRAFEEYWFGARSLARIEVLLGVMRARYGAFPAALSVLHRWPDMLPETRRSICHWHLQLADPLYRAFTGDFLVERRHADKPPLTREIVVGWVGKAGSARWNMATRIQFASKLLTAAHSAGLVATRRDPRPLSLPRVPDDALEYLMYLLREIDFEDTLLENPYLRSVGLEGPALEDRLRGLPGLAFRRQADLVDFGWKHEDLDHWERGRPARIPKPERRRPNHWERGRPARTPEPEGRSPNHWERGRPARTPEPEGRSGSPKARTESLGDSSDD